MLKIKVTIMGCIQSKSNFIEPNDGDEKDFHDRYLEDRVLGEGEFGVVKMVHDMKASPSSSSKQQQMDVEPLAVKQLRKGITFKNNTLYAPLKPEALRREVEILRRLNGKQYNLKLFHVYESSNLIRIVTEMCSGGEMMEYVTKTYVNQGLRTEDVSRIAFQLLSAIHHCAKNGIIHRDVKPENVMFRHPEPGSELRLIDYGSGTIDVNPTNDHDHDVDAPLTQHATFAGSAFYISPEMFQRTYTYKTDVWSVGATLYVLVAGFPAEQLQKAFNILHKSRNRDLRTLPNMPDNLPDSYYEMLEELLRYRHKSRKSAGEMLHCEFAQFHIEHAADEAAATAAVGADANGVNNNNNNNDDDARISLEQIAAEAAEMGNTNGRTIGNNNGSTTKRKTQSVLLEGSVLRHQSYLGYQKFERAVTTLLATVLSRSQFRDLLSTLSDRLRYGNDGGGGGGGSIADASKAAAVVENNGHDDGENGFEVLTNEKKLQVIPIGELKSLLKELGLNEAVEMMEKLPNASIYNNFAYRIVLLTEFATDKAIGITSSSRRVKRSMSFDGSGEGRRGTLKKTASGLLARGGGVDDNDSIHSSGSTGKGNNSVHGNNVWDSWKKRKGIKKTMSVTVRRNGDELNGSSHL